MRMRYWAQRAGFKLLAWGGLGLAASLLLVQPIAAQRARRVLPPLSHFAVIEEKNLFHPDRILQTPAPTPAPKEAVPPKLPPAHFVLQGVILYDEGKSIALLKEPKLTEQKVKSFAQGEKIGPYVLKAVKKDRVVMSLGNQEFEVIMNNAKNPIQLFR